MKFVCGTCNAKYTIADERVAGKTLKIRCKSCNAIIEVSGAPAETARPGKARPVESKPTGHGGGLAGRFADSFKSGAEGKAPLAPGLFQSVKRSAENLEKDETAIAAWFVAVDDKPLGPIAARVIRRHQQAGKVTDDSLVWKEGMPDWVPLRNCKDLVGMLARLEIAESLEEEPSAGKPEPAPRQVTHGGLFAGDSAAQAAVVSPLRGQRVGRVDEVQDSPPAPAEQAADAPAAAVPAKAAGAERDFFGDFPDPAGMEDQLSALIPISPPTGRNRWITLAAVGFLGIAIAVLGVAIFTGGSPETRVITEVVEKVIEVEKEKIVYRDKPQADAVGDDVGESERKVAAARPRTGQASATGTAAKGGAETADDKKKKLLEQMGLGAPSGDQKLVGGTDKTSGAAKGSGSSALTEDQIRRTLAANRNSIQLCYERALKKGEVPDDRGIRANTNLIVGGSGMVRSVNVTGTAAQYTALKTCIESAVKKWVFPSSSGDSPVEIPTLFSPK